MSPLLKLLRFLPLVLMLNYGPASSCQTFTNPVRVATPVDPDSVVAADVNGDGQVDLIWFQVTATASIGHIDLAQTNGSYLEVSQVTIPGAPSGVPLCAAADVTQDGKVDLICATYYSAVSSTTVDVFPGNGDGTFGALTANAVGNQFEPSILTLAGDLNGDGVADFILEQDFYTPALVLLSDGKGAFLPPLTVPNSYNYSTPVIADINGDGIPDVLWPEGAGVALGNGDGTFGNLLSPFTIGDGPETCAFHDMDGDGKLDAVCGYIPTSNGIDSEPGTALDILHGNGDGTFNRTPISHQTFGSSTIGLSGVGDFLAPILIRDLNGDGIPDVLGLSGDGLAVLLGQTGLTFKTPSHYAPAFTGPDFSAYVSAQSVYTDLNGDGLIDVLDAGPNGMYLLYGRADGSFGSAVATTVSEVNGHIAVADFNGDGKPDIVSTGAPGTSLSLGDGEGGFGAPVTVPGAPFVQGASIYVADFNGDGKADLLSTDASFAYHLMLGNGDGTFAAAIATTGLAPAPSSTSIGEYTVPYGLTADLNSDGTADLFSITTSSLSPTYSLVSALSKGNGTFQSVTTSYPAPASPPYYDTPVAPVLADFAHRGKLDAAYFLNESVYIVQGNGDGSFASTPTMLATPTVAGLQADYFQALQTADFDGDGNVDIAFLAWYVPTFEYYGGPSCVFVYWGNGDGTFSAPTQAGCFTHTYTDMRGGDFNADGRPDLVLQTASELNNYVVGVIDNLGSRTFGPELNYTAGSLSGDIFVTDLNGDGRPDLVFGNQQYESGYSADSVTVLLNQKATIATGTLTSAPNPSYYSQAFAITATLTPPTAGTVYAGNLSFSVDGVASGQVALSSNAATIAGPATLTPGMHSLSATWPGDANDPALTLTATQTVLPYPLTITLSCSPASSMLGQTVVLATQFAIMEVGGAVPVAPYTGTLSFYDGSTLLEQQSVAAENFNYSTSALPGGTDTLSARYTGDPFYANASASCTEDVNQLATTSQLSLGSTPVAGVPFQMIATVTPTSATTLQPTGTVSFTIDGASVGSGTVGASTGITTYNDAGISGGNHTFGCSYGGDGSFAGSACAPIAATVAPALSALSLSSSSNPAAAGSPIRFNAGLSGNGQPAAGDVVAFTIATNGVTQAQGSATTDASGNATFPSAGLPPGTYTVSARFAGDPSLRAATAPTLTQVVAIVTTSISLTASPNPGYVGQNVSLTATVTTTSTAASSPTISSGTVSFFDGTTPLGTASLNASGTATLETTSLGVGVHSLSTSLAASTFFTGSISAAYSETILASTFTIGLSPATVTVVSGKTAASTINLGSLGVFAGPLTLTHGAVPMYGTLSIEPSAVTLAAGGTAASSVSLNTLDAAANTASARSGFPNKLVAVPSAALLLLPLLPRRKRFARLLLLAGATFLLQAVIGCGNSFYIADSVAPGTYVIPITATDTNGNSQAANFTVVVTPLSPP